MFIILPIRLIDFSVAFHWNESHCAEMAAESHYTEIYYKSVYHSKDYKYNREFSVLDEKIPRDASLYLIS